MLRIREIRENLDKMQKDVAQELGISRTTYNQYETGKRAPDQETLVKLAQYYSVSTDYLLGITDDPTPPGQKKEALPTLEEAERAYKEVLIRTKMKEKGKTMTQEDRERMERVVEMGLRILRESSE